MHAHQPLGVVGKASYQLLTAVNNLLQLAVRVVAVLHERAQVFAWCRRDDGNALELATGLWRVVEPQNAPSAVRAFLQPPNARLTAQ
ncbi:hypothetical protein D3C72_1221560 [compost metagenome]